MTAVRERCSSFSHAAIGKLVSSSYSQRMTSGAACPCSVDRAVDPYDAFSRESELPEIPPNVLGNKFVTPHAERAERRLWMVHENIVDRSTRS
jgi:hypothetical protein